MGGTLMKRLLSFVLSFFLVFALLPAGSFAAATATVMGKVTEDREDGDPVGGAKVVAKDRQSGAVLGTAVSNAQGNYSMVLPIGADIVLSLEPPPFYSQEAPDTPPQRFLGEEGWNVNWIVDNDEAIAWFVGGGIVVTAGIVGGVLGSRGNGGGKKKIITGTQ